MGGPRGTVIRDFELDYDNLQPTDIIAVIIPSPNVQQESTRRFKGINARGGITVVGTQRTNQAPIVLRFAIIEGDMLEQAAAAIGVRRHHFIRQAALSMAEAVLHGDQSSEHPNVRVSIEGYKRRRVANLG